MTLEGKIIDFLGDSITEGVGVADRENNRYDNVLKKTCNLKATYNYGIGGTRFAHQSVPSEKPRHDLCFCGRVYDLNKDADIIVVYGGVNDYIHGDAPIGKWGDATPATFYGAVRFLMNFLKTEYSDKTIVFMSPARLSYNGITWDKPSNRPTKKSDAMPLLGYIEIIKKTAELYGIPVLDLHEKLGIDPMKDEDKIKYTSDGLHFNDAGQHVIAQRLREFLQAL
ncbi:MAG: SGNH/GDSL hydrolase family protein [Clostridia bacterium]|nr:SGNH/GDSL hydrolase family protein [Clostridia bacterium]